ncbi:HYDROXYPROLINE-RICH GLYCOPROTEIN FAMILY PROTEIN [Salix koriyanagi]|uniref:HYDROXYPROLINE-RICH GLYCOPROTEIN FAMILY PROTEIN n=1 Tax=Salix koriyanagi TaxID=2511006 RepID=A0A9Q0PI56_9ROSI|nr:HYDROXYPROLINE-RICH GLYCOPROTEIN FAMILY PROTEIN [Salix koriyanagi]
MAGLEIIDSSRKKHVRQPPSVPFLWEVRPGVAKKDWKPEVSSVTPVQLPPVKLIASVPFNWEEKPGKPLSCFSQSPESAFVPAQANLLALPWHEDDDTGEESFGDEQVMFNSDLESFSFETDGSFSSAPSLLANCLVSSVAISTAAPVQTTSPTDDCNGQQEAPWSPTSETDSSTSSYATGVSSLEGAAFLECLFPLYTPKSGFLGKASHPRKESFTPELISREFDYERKSSAMIRKPLTLGELIMMSRRRSCQRKAVQMRKQNLSMKFMDKNAFGCCIFGTSINMIEELQRKMRQPRLKII